MITGIAQTQKKQDNGRYVDNDQPVTDPGYVYRALATAFYRHHLNTYSNRIQCKRIDDNTMQFIVTYYGNQFRTIFTVDNIGIR